MNEGRRSNEKIVLAEDEDYLLDIPIQVKRAPRRTDRLKKQEQPSQQ